MLSTRTPIKRHSSYDVYMLRCADGTYYTGYTHDVEARVTLHNSGHGAKSLQWKGKLPVALVYAKAYRYYMRALQAEQWLKRRSRAEKEALIQGYEKAMIGKRRLSPQVFSPLRGEKTTRGDIHMCARAE